LWAFGDTKTSTQTSPVYTYSDAGTFTVRLTTTSNYGCTDFSDRKVIINPRPFTFFTTGISSQCLRSNLFFLDNRSTVNPGTIANTYWQFGDGDSSELFSPQHKYNSVGKFTIFLKVVTDAGCSDTTSKKVEVNPQPEAGIIVSDTALCFKNNLFQFTDYSKTSVGFITDYYWHFGDGTFNNLQNTSHVYTSSKTFLIKHVVTSSNGCKDTTTKTIVVHAMPVAKFTVNDSIQCQKGNSFVLTNTTTPSGSLYNWKFGDGGTSADTSPTHSYANFGPYTIQLISVSPENCSDTFERSVSVKESPVVDLGRDTILYHNQSITLDAGGVYDSYDWSNSKTTQTILIDTNDIGLDNPTLFWVNVDLQACEESDSITITFIQNVSINEQADEFNIVVYPNPSKDYIYIGLDRIIEDLTISLRDMNGKILSVEPQQDKSQYRLDLSGFAKGVYFLNLTSNDATRVVKVIKY
jgi:PKD repeat protein